VPAVARAAGCEVFFYSINNNFEISEDVYLVDSDLILLVNYFGLCRPQVEKQLGQFRKESVIVDCSQAYFQAPFDCLATIYSPRKFLPVPDGGVVHTSIQLEEHESDEHASIGRYRYLLERATEEPELSRTRYLAAEAQLEEPSFRRMSAFTKKIIEVTDIEFIRHKRSKNWGFLTELDASNKLKFEVDGQIAICYPLMIDNALGLQNELRKRRIFTPLYWPAVQISNTHEKDLVNNTIYLPIDHRYGELHMRMLVDFFKESSVIA
jgi:hypothetical protein